MARAWIIFDADNTLWDVEDLYDRARDTLCDFLAAKGVPPQVVAQYQQERDRSLYAIYKYSACRFPRSFEDTVLHFFPNAGTEAIVHARFLASKVFDDKAVPYTGVDHVITSLHNHYNLAIVTSGERWVQQKRLDDFHLFEYFTKLMIVEEKNEKVIDDFCVEHSIDKTHSWVIGDSVKSDILPAISVGLNAILVLHRNWEVVERQSLLLPEGIPAVRSIKEILPYILQHDYY